MFADNLKRLRAAKGVTQQELAELAGLPVGSVRNWEIARREPRLHVLPRLARALGCTTDDLLRGLGEDEPKSGAKGRAKNKRPKK
jgi:transcriptional regulator with XRE-family HTH domain